MDAFPSPQPCAVGEVDKNQTEKQYDLSYAAAVSSRNHSAEEVSNLELCPVSIENGTPTVEFTVEDVNSFTREEGLHQAVVIKFSYGKPALQDLRQILPKLFEVKGCYSIGQLEYCHILVRFDLFEDFAKVVSRSSAYVQSKGDAFFFRTFPWTMGFNPREETSKAVVWISFPQLPANLFARKSLMSIASAVRKPITVEKATKDRTRPRTARVKVLINILDKHPNKIKIKIFDTKTGKMVENEQQIVIDNLPKFCTLCNHRDHDEKSCRWNTEDFNVKVPLSNETEGNNSLIESGRDARELLNEIKEGHRAEMNPISGKFLTAKHHAYASNSTAAGNFSSKNAMVGQQSIANVSASLLEKSNNVTGPNDNAQQDSTKKTVSLKSTSLASIENSKSETCSISGIKMLNAQQKYNTKQWRAVQPSRMNSNADVVSDVSVLELDKAADTEEIPLKSSVASKVNAGNDQGYLNQKGDDSVFDATVQERPNVALDTISEASQSPISESMKKSTLSFVNETLNLAAAEFAIAALEFEVASYHANSVVQKSEYKADPILAGPLLSHSANADGLQAVYPESFSVQQKESISNTIAVSPIISEVASKSVKVTDQNPVPNADSFDEFNGQQQVYNEDHSELSPHSANVAATQSVISKYAASVLSKPNAIVHSKSQAAGSPTDEVTGQQKVDNEDPSEQISLSANAADPQTVFPKHAAYVMSKPNTLLHSKASVSPKIGKELRDQTEGDQLGNEAARLQFSQDTQTFKDAGEINEKENWTSISNKNRKPESKTQQQSEMKCTDVPTDLNSFAALVNINDENENQTVTKDGRAESQIDNLEAVDKNKGLTTSTNAAIKDALQQQKEDEERYRLKGKAVAPYIPSSQKKKELFSEKHC